MLNIIQSQKDNNANSTKINSCFHFDFIRKERKISFARMSEKCEG